MKTNKNFLKKLTAGILGFVMTLGVGAAGYAASASETKAVDPTYHIIFDANHNSGSIGSYTDTWTNSTDNLTWTLTNFNNNNNKWDYVKCGRKNYTSTGTIISDTVPVAIGKIDIVIGGLTSSKINSLVLYGGTDGSTKISDISKSAGTVSIDIPENKQSANQKYKLVCDCASGSSNGLFQLNDIKLYAISGPTPATSFDMTTNFTNCSWDGEDTFDGSEDYVAEFEPADGYDSVELDSVVYTGGSDVDSDSYLFEDNGLLIDKSALTADITVTAHGVSSVDPKSLESISIKTAPNKIRYIEGDYFDPTGLEITATYDDQSTLNVSYSDHSSDFTFNPTTSTALTTSNTSVTITYGGKSITQAITVTRNTSQSLIIDGGGSFKTKYPNSTTYLDGTDTFTYSGVDVEFNATTKSYNLAKDGSATNYFSSDDIFIGKENSTIRNTTPIPGAITKFEMLVCKNAAKAGRYWVTFSDKILTESGGSSDSNTYHNTQDFTVDTIIDLTSYISDGAKYFFFEQKASNTNARVQFKITYNSMPQVDLDKKSINLTTSSDTTTVKATASNFSGTVDSYAWSVVGGEANDIVSLSNTATDTVSISPLKPGTTKIKCVVTRGEETAEAECSISVSAAPTSITLSGTDYSYNETTRKYEFTTYDSYSFKSMPSVVVNPYDSSKEEGSLDNAPQTVEYVYPENSYISPRGTDGSSQFNILRARNENEALAEIVIKSTVDASKQATLVIEVLEDVVDELTYTGTLTGKQYIGEPFNPEGLTFKKHYPGKGTVDANISELTFPTITSASGSVVVKLGDIEANPIEYSGAVNPSVIIDQGATATVSLGSTLNLTATVLPAGKTLTWSSSNNSIATVSNAGVVTPVATGNVDITATYKTGVSATIAITVTAPHGASPDDPLTPEEAGTSFTKVVSTYYVRGYFHHWYSDSGTTIDFYIANSTTSTKTYNVYSFDNAQDYSREHFGVGAIVTIKYPASKLPLSTSSYNSGGEIYSIEWTDSRVDSVTLSDNSLTLVNGIDTSKILTATVEGYHYPSQKIIWESNDESVVTVNNGVVALVGLGTTTVVAKSEQDQSKFATCNIIVRNPQHTSKITLNKDVKQLYIDEELTLVPYFDGDDTGVTWSSSDSLIASVDSNGKVTAESVGSVLITATSTYNNNIKAECYIKVISAPSAGIQITSSDFNTSYSNSEATCKENGGFNYKNVMDTNVSGTHYGQVRSNSYQSYIRNTSSINLDKLVIDYDTGSCSVYKSTSEITYNDYNSATLVTPTISETDGLYTYDLSNSKYVMLVNTTSNAVRFNYINVFEVQSPAETSIFDDNEAFENWTSGAVTISNENINAKFDANSVKNGELNKPVVSKDESSDAVVLVDSATSGKFLTSVSFKLDKLTSDTRYTFQYQTNKGGEWKNYVPSKGVTRGAQPESNTLTFEDGVNAVRIVVSQGSIVIFNVDGVAESGKAFEVTTTSELAFDYTVDDGTVTNVSNVKLYFTAEIAGEYESENYRYGIMLAKVSDLDGMSIEEAFNDPTKSSCVKTSTAKSYQESYTLTLSVKNASNYSTEYAYVFYVYDVVNDRYYFGVQDSVSVKELAEGLINKYEKDSEIYQALGLLAA